MAYTEFSTQNAEYVLQLGNHTAKNTHNCFEGIDAMVIETGSSSLDQLVRNRDLQMNLPISCCREKNIPIFGADVCPTGIGEHIRSINILTLLSNVIMVHYSVTKKKLNRFLGRFCSDWNYIMQEPITEWRDAVNARKIEEDIVPRVVEISGREHPRLALVYGAAHIGMEYDLKSRKRRDFTIWNMRNLNFGRYAGLVREQLNVVYEARCDKDSWKIYEHHVDLFR